MTEQWQGGARQGALASIVAASLLLGCGGRDGDLDARLAPSSTVGLSRAVVLADDPLSRVVVLTSAGPDQLSATPLAVGQGIARLQPDVTGDGLLVLSNGVQPRRHAGDELPSLTRIDTSGAPQVTARYELAEPFSQLTLDPEGRWVVLSGASENFVTNPNQLVLIDLSAPDSEPVTKTIRSFGAAPDRLRFTAELDVPGGPRRFLIVETRQDVTLIDLENPSSDEITIRLPQTPSGATGRSLGVVVHPGAEAEPEDARLAIRLANDPNLVLVSFTPAEDGAAAPFNLTLNLVDVGAPPAELDFVDTDGGLRLAALVPGRREAALVEPATTRVERVSLPAGFDRLRRVASDAMAADGDVALLWSQETSMVAFWSLGRTSARAFRSVDVLNLEAQIVDVLDVPGDRLGHRKLLSARDSRFFVLDLALRQSFPMVSSGNLSLAVAPDGERAWAYARGTNRFAQIDLDTLEPKSLVIDHPIDAIFDVAAGEGRTLIALHASGAHGATLLDAENPDTASTRFVPGLLLGGLQ